MVRSSLSESPWVKGGAVAVTARIPAARARWRCFISVEWPKLPPMGGSSQSGVSSLPHRMVAAAPDSLRHPPTPPDKAYRLRRKLFSDLLLTARVDFFLFCRNVACSNEVKRDSNTFSPHTCAVSFRTSRRPPTERHGSPTLTPSAATDSTFGRDGELMSARSYGSFSFNLQVNGLRHDRSRSPAAPTPSCSRSRHCGSKPRKNLRATRILRPVYQ